MAGFLTTTNINDLTAAYLKHWQTFYKPITITKEPIKTIVTNNNTTLPIFGYGEESQPTTSYTYTSVTGIFMAQVTVDLNQKAVELEDIKNTVGKGTIRIKVQQDCRDFIEDGRKTESIQYGEQIYNTLALDGLQNFFGLKFYTYFLERTR